MPKNIIHSQTKDIKIFSPKVVDILLNYPSIETLHLRRTFTNKLCLVGINQALLRDRIYTTDKEQDLPEEDKALLVELDLKSDEVRDLIKKIHKPWIERFILSNLPFLRGKSYSRNITFSRSGQIEIHKKTGKPTKNDIKPN